MLNSPEDIQKKLSDEDKAKYDPTPAKKGKIWPIKALWALKEIEAINREKIIEERKLDKS